MEMAESFWRNRALIFQLTKREVLGRYRGSVAGLGWSLLHPHRHADHLYVCLFNGVSREVAWSGRQSKHGGFCARIVRRIDCAWHLCRMRQSRT